MRITLQDVYDCASESERELPLYLQVGEEIRVCTRLIFADGDTLVLGGWEISTRGFTLNSIYRERLGRKTLMLEAKDGPFLPVRSQYTQITEDETGKHGAQMLVLSSKEA